MRRIGLFLLLMIFLNCNILTSAERLVVAIVKTSDNTAYNQALEGFKELFAAKNVSIWSTEYNLKKDKENGDSICEQIRSKSPDVIFTIGTLATKVVSDNIENIPIVFCMVLNPDSIDRKSNVTGVLIDIPQAMKLEVIKKFLPNANKIGVVFSPETKGLVKDLETISRRMGYKLVSKQIDSEKELPEVFEGLSWQIDVLLMVPDVNIYTLRSTKYIVLKCLQNKVALFGLSRPYTKAGALLSLDCDFKDIGRQAADISIRIGRGERPYNIPLALPEKNNLTINSNTAENIKIEISPDVFKEAMEVFGR